MHELFSLHKYFVYQDTIRLQFEKYLMNKELNNSKAYTNIYLDLWYGTLFVVAEWWKELRLEDDKINSLLKSSNYELLRRYRNCVFHFQKDWHDPRFDDFHKEDSTVDWTIKLHTELWRFFLEKIKEWKLAPPPLPEWDQ